MKQMLQNLKSGKISVAEVPRPLLLPEGIVVRTHKSLISAGTEKMMLELGKKSLLGKAKERPDLVKKVLEKVRRDGFLATFKTVRDKLDSDMPLGYSNAGEVLEVGARARRFEVGQRVACAGAGFANHAEVNYIPRLLAVGVPEGVSMEAAAYATVGTIALQGVRLADLRVGETVVVLGLGLIGQLTVQILKASGCRVVGLDFAADRVELAAAHGADLALAIEGEVTEKRVLAFTRGRGADAVVITAATSSNEPVEQAARLARDRARVIMVGVTGMDLPRRDYFQKELTFMVSRSYGPGRYDPDYEEHGHDYPIGYVRWTENRNIEAFLDLVASGGVRPEALTTHRFPIAEADKAFELILTGSEPYLGVVLDYPEDAAGPAAADVTRIELPKSAAAKSSGTVGVSFIGAGGFARSFHLPNLVKLSSARPRGIIDASGVAARAAGDKFGFAFCGSSEEDVLGDAETDAVFLMTPHSQHADGVCRGLAAGKSVFVEKPLAIDIEGLRKVCRAVEAHSGSLMVGFNRRFSPAAVMLKEFLADRGPLAVQYRCNAGPLPEKHWIADPAEGGRIIGEACHFFDLFAFLTGAAPAMVMAAAPSTGSADDAAVTVTYEDGSVCQLVYTTVGPGSYGKERLEAFAGGAAGMIDDFRVLTRHGGKRRMKPVKWMQADKGHAQELSAFVESLRDGQPSPISVPSLIDTTLVTFAALASIQRGEPVALAAMRQLLRADDHPTAPPENA
ncbi:MAG: bi-domain-containing oxidoreductase, partial [Pirellulales bacterium]|nr:bi-domain-containing oxidoreductase [Pirellulales bacterium]